jgi:magnesium chelatase family protein
VLGRAVTFALVGLEPRRVEVEAHLPKGIPAFTVVGLADRACQEAKHRVRSGVISAQLAWPDETRITVNLAPAALRKEGTGFDLPIALALLAASRQVPPERLADNVCLGELALDGRVRPVTGAIAAAEGAVQAGFRRILCAAPSAPEAALAGIEALPVRHLAEAVSYLRGEIDLQPRTPPRATVSVPTWQTSVGRSAAGGRSRSPPPASTTSFSRGHREPARRCWPDGCPPCCRR